MYFEQVFQGYCRIHNPLRWNAGDYYVANLSITYGGDIIPLIFFLSIDSDEYFKKNNRLLQIDRQIDIIHLISRYPDISQGNCGMAVIEQFLDQCHIFSLPISPKPKRLAH